MNKSDVQGSPRGAATAQDQTPNSKYGAAASSASKAGSPSGALPSDHVCTDACTHEGATRGKSTSPVAPGAGKVQPAAARGGNDSTAGGN